MSEIDRTWKQDYLYRMFSHHTKDKEKENYVGQRDLGKAG